MRIFVAGASGVIGRDLVPLLRQGGHEVAGMTRSAERAGAVAELGAEPVVCDVYDAAGLSRAVRAFAPEMVMHQLTDLPDDLKRLPLHMRRNNRIRTEGTRNLVAAAREAGASRFLAQSIASCVERTVVIRAVSGGPGERGTDHCAHPLNRPEEACGSLRLGLWDGQRS